MEQNVILAEVYIGYVAIRKKQVNPMLEKGFDGWEREFEIIV